MGTISKKVIQLLPRILSAKFLFLLPPKRGSGNFYSLLPNKIPNVYLIKHFKKLAGKKTVHLIYFKRTLNNFKYDVNQFCTLLEYLLTTKRFFLLK